MSNKGRALVESFVLHGILVGGMIVLAGVLAPPPQPIYFDLRLLQQQDGPALKIESQQKIAVNGTTSVSNPPQQKPVASLVQTRSKREKVREASQIPKILSGKIQKNFEKPREQGKPIKSMTAAAEPAVTSAGVAPRVSGFVPAPANGGTRSDAAKVAQPKKFSSEEYVRTNFDEIRNSILTQLRYPVIARRRGWSGKVEVAFQIAPDGSISGLRIEASSGYSILDEQALAAITNSAPFTPPGIVAQVVMPVTFQLN